MEHGPGKMEYKNGQWEITCMCGEWGCPEDWDYNETYYAMGSHAAIKKFKEDLVVPRESIAGKRTTMENLDPKAGE